MIFSLFDDLRIKSSGRDVVESTFQYPRLEIRDPRYGHDKDEVLEPDVNQGKQTKQKAKSLAQKQLSPLQWRSYNNKIR